MTGRYDAAGAESEFQPGSRGRVLRNRRGITSVRQLEREESDALLAASQKAIDTTRVDQRFAASDIRTMHHHWLGELYEWAGEYRTVNISKGAFTFAAAVRVTALMKEFERGPLREYTPCRFGTLADQASALAIVHSELILTHPFRQWTEHPVTRDANGSAGWIAAAGFRRNPRSWKARIYCCRPFCIGS
jgi:cell filamentation protein